MTLSPMARARAGEHGLDAARFCELPGGAGADCGRRAAAEDGGRADGTPCDEAILLLQALLHILNP